MARFWWGNGSEDRKIHWRSWDKTCKPKGECGLGFHDLYAFNMAVLAKPGWMVIHHPSSLIAQIFKARYFPISSFWEPKAPPSLSHCWESIVRA
ncbi:hypothetical protein FF1_018936 [Malus domestica]